jgi:hypothetical protein
MPVTNGHCKPTASASWVEPKLYTNKPFIASEHCRLLPCSSNASLKALEIASQSRKLDDFGAVSKGGKVWTFRMRKTLKGKEEKNG